MGFHSPRCSQGKFGQCLPPQTPRPLPAGTRGHWDPILAPGSGLGLAGARFRGGGPAICGQDKDKDANQPGRAGPDKKGCILHTYINTVQGEETLVGRRSAALQGVPHWSCPWDPSWTLFRLPREGGGVVPP